MLLTSLYYLLVLVGVLIGVSFYTLFERKVMGLTHIRSGPTLVGYLGLLQPFSDAVKLFTKEAQQIKQSNSAIYLLSPLIVLSVSFLIWGVAPAQSGFFGFKYLLLIFLIVSSISVYAHLGCGWGSNSIYSMIGGLRCVAQSVSYEVGLAILFMSVALLAMSLDLTCLSEAQTFMPWVMVLLPVSIGWWISSVAESNRSPFDFAEGESELVSGFNVEYSSALFAMLFMAEYGSMIFMSLLTTYLFFGGVSSVTHLMVWGSLLYLYVWFRVSYPRTRYDKLMMLGWWFILPGGISYCTAVLTMAG